MIKIESLNMSYPEQKRFREYFLYPFKPRKRIPALHGINLQINEGEQVAFMGPNGSGKTSLLKLIAGLLIPETGSVSIQGATKLATHKRSVGIVMNEERSFYWRLSGYKNLEFFGSLDNIFKPELTRKIDELVELLHLGDFIHKNVGTYSSGMKQRLATARGLLSDPKILILDEPTRTLDPKSTEEMIRLIGQVLYKGMNKTILIASHRFEEVGTLCSRICLLKDGRIAADMTTADIERQYRTNSNYYNSFFDDPAGTEG